MTPTINLAALDRALVPVGRFVNLFLREPGFDGFDHSAHRVDLAEIVPGLFFEFAGQLLDEVRAAERVDGVGRAGFVSDDLLSPRAISAARSVGRASASS